MSNQNEFSNYWSASHPDTFYLDSLPSFKSVGLSFQEFNINGRNGDYLEFTIKKKFSYFGYASNADTSYQVRS